ncbi:hypothetical protein ADEAN_000276000 [Angomonas deanei]|uniref:PH domain containing protein n=1 Tax=Angomonas deanei TaxID=59799 RepID=A0A7G2C769_9TRYP|nr:hypothetical protein ADEAN_000276000 [Angomonas deanei]
MCSSDIITLRDFSASVLACTVPDITLMQRTVEKMLAFIKVCRDTLLKSSKAPKPSSTKSLQYGFWVHRSIHPSVMPSWKRSWAILTEENVLRLCVPNTTRSHMEFSFERIENCKLNAMQSNTGAPKPYRRNGVLIRITSDPEPLEVRLCTEVSEHAHALVKAYRNWKKVRENLLPSPSLSLAREKSVSMGATEVEVDTSDLSRVEVWCCPKQTYEHSVWSFAHGVLIHYSASNAQTTYMWNLEGVEEVTRIQSVPVLPPYPLRETLCFVIRRSGGKNIFCCTDSLRKTNYCIATLRQYLLRNQILPNTAVALQYPVKAPGRYGRTGSCSTSRRSLNSSIASSISTPVARRYVENDAPSPIPLFPK